MTALEKLNSFMYYPCEEHLLTIEEFETLTPHNKGFCLYVQAAWDKSPLSELPCDYYKEGSEEAKQFKDGSFAGMIWAQNSEDNNYKSD
jgi:hypothetical protein